MKRAKSSHSLWDVVLAEHADTLFLEREGVVIELTPDGTHADTLLFRPDFLAAVPQLAEKFRRIIVLSHTGVDHKVDEAIHRRIDKAGGRVDAFYSRPPAPFHGSEDYSAAPMLVLNARRDYPDINLAHAVLVGASREARLLAFNCGMKFHTTAPEGTPEAEEVIPLGTMDQELGLLRDCILQSMDVLTKLMNSHVRINGLRLAARCCCHAIAGGNKIVMLLSDDSGFHPEFVPQFLNTIIKGATHQRHAFVLLPEGSATAAERVHSTVVAGDVVWAFAFNPNHRAMEEALDVARSLGAVTISATGAKPGGLDVTDVVIKVPSTQIGYVQAVLKVIAVAIHTLIDHEIRKQLMF